MFSLVWPMRLISTLHKSPGHMSEDLPLLLRISMHYSPSPLSPLCSVPHIPPLPLPSHIVSLCSPCSQSQVNVCPAPIHYTHTKHHVTLHTPQPYTTYTHIHTHQTPCHTTHTTATHQHHTHIYIHRTICDTIHTTATHQHHHTPPSHNTHTHLYTDHRHTYIYTHIPTTNIHHIHKHHRDTHIHTTHTCHTHTIHTPHIPQTHTASTHFTHTQTDTQLSYLLPIFLPSSLFLPFSSLSSFVPSSLSLSSPYSFWVLFIFCM